MPIDVLRHTSLYIVVM